ncbi:MAG: hypothetical protein AA908_05365 [Chlorobi bacterium NICIL-2]|nr:MAG: hypothetical protein AA908_05365 [Chlorobi bacterium NICIL-2]
MKHRIGYLLVLVLTNALVAQTIVSIPDTTAYRGSVLTLPVRIDRAVLQDDTITVTFEYSQASLRIEQIAARFPGELRILRSAINTAPSAERGTATVEAIAVKVLPYLELDILCSVLWSGSSPASVTVSALEINHSPQLLSPEGGQITLLPGEALTVEGSPSLGPLRPQPLYEPRLEVTYWLGDDGQPSFVLFDPLGREYGQWSVPPQSAGPHTIALELERMATAAGVYYLRMQVGPHILIAPCVIGK